MRRRHRVGRAEALAERTVARLGGARPTVDFVLDAARAFEEVPFAVPEGEDADGFVHQWGPANWYARPTFSWGLTRQLIVPDRRGEEQRIVQVGLDLLFDPDDALTALGSGSAWWFRDEGAPPFERWLADQAADSRVAVLRQCEARSFELSVDEAC